ncbi:MAG: hypothetical protein K2U26_17185 [Cyclobacteriaceae bacterium]|nr:hypothetical protein [Cyclobacteriaceae bacterium]
MSDIKSFDEQEEFLQREAEQSQLKATDADSRAYRHVFRALQQEPEFKLSPSFSVRVTSRLQSATTRPTREYVWLALGLLCFIGGAVFAVMQLQFTPDWGFLKGMARFGYLFIFGAVFIFVLQWVDKKFIRPTLTH